jgi:hypothetical protein
MVFGRDVGILVVAAILYAAAGRREFTPSIFGKANTLAQVAAVAAVLLPAHRRPLGGGGAHGRPGSHHGAHRRIRLSLRMAGFAPGGGPCAGQHYRPLGDQDRGVSLLP